MSTTSDPSTSSSSSLAASATEVRDDATLKMPLTTQIVLHIEHTNTDETIKLIETLISSLNARTGIVPSDHFVPVKPLVHESFAESDEGPYNYYSLPVGTGQQFVQVSLLKKGKKTPIPLDKKD